MNEYLVTFRGAYGNVYTAYIYGDSEYDARLNANQQGISRYSILSVKLFGKRQEYGHI